MATQPDARSFSANEQRAREVFARRRNRDELARAFAMIATDQPQLTAHFGCKVEFTTWTR